MASRPVFLHIGTGKSGTSSLQAALWGSGPELAKEGVGLPFERRLGAVRNLLAPLGWVVAEGFTGPVDRQGLRRFARRLRRTDGESLLISNEDLAEARQDSIEALFEAITSADMEPRVIVTARDWSKQLPSDYQQLLKHNITHTFDAFLREVKDRVGIGEQFWLRQDLPDICHRWSRGLDPAHVHVVPVPPYKVDPDAIYRLFGGVVGFDPGVLRMPTRDTNASFGAVEAEVLRRFNVALGDRLSDYPNEYLPAVRNELIRYCIARGASVRLALPTEHVGWVRALSEQRVALLRSGGYTLHGDPSSLVVPADAGRSVSPVTDAEIASAAIETLATFTIRAFNQRRAARAAGAGEGRP